jgi:predicted PurR-regulated permease PerM
MVETLERQRVATMMFYGAVLLLSYLVFRLFEPFLRPLGWAAVLVIFFYPGHGRFERRWGRTAGAWISTFLVGFVLVVPAIAVGYVVASEAPAAADAIQRGLASGRIDVVQEAWDGLQRRVFGEVRISLSTIVSDVAGRAAGLIAAGAGAMLRDVAIAVFDFVLILFAAFFLFRDGPAIVAAIRRALPFDDATRDVMIRQTHDLIYAGITASLLVAVIQGSLTGLAFGVLGIAAPVFWGVVATFFALLPFAGAWVVWGPAVIWLMAAGHVGSALALLGVGAGIVGLVDNVVRPALLAGRAQMNGLLVLVSLLGGLSVFGMLGLVLGPVIMAIAVGLFQAYTAPRVEMP